MIPATSEIRASIRGALRLAQRDPGGIEEFTLSIDGFFNSFFAAVLALPFVAILLARQYDTDHVPSLGAIFLGEGVSYAVGWLAFPVVAIFLTRFYGLGARYVPLVVAVNWTELVQSVLFVGIVLLSDAFGGPAGSLLFIAGVVGILVYEWYVVRTALATTSGIAAAFVGVDLVLSLVISAVAEAALRA